MKLLEQRILTDGVIKHGNILKVDSFLNHQMDVKLYREIGEEFYRIFKDCGVTRILTIEASGIGLACVTAQFFDVPAVFAKKNMSKNLDGELFTTSVESFTRGGTYQIVVSKKYIKPGDRVLIIDDFLAKGNALLGLIDIVEKADAEVAGCGVAIEKGFQEGGQILRSMGVNLHSLAIIDHMDEHGIVFRENDG